MKSNKCHVLSIIILKKYYCVRDRPPVENSERKRLLPTHCRKQILTTDKKKLFIQPEKVFLHTWKSIYHVHNYQTYKLCITVKYIVLYQMIHDFVVFFLPLQNIMVLGFVLCSAVHTPSIYMYTRSIIEMNKYFQ